MKHTLLGQSAFALETVAHLRGKEAVLLPLAEGLRTLEGALGKLDLRCRFDALNPCWSNRPTDVIGKHWGGGDACPECTVRALTGVRS